MPKLSEIKLIDETTKDFTRALNYSMKESKKPQDYLQVNPAWTDDKKTCS